MNIVFLISFFLVFVNLALLAYKDIKYYILPDTLNINLAVLFLSFHISSGFTIETLASLISGAITSGGFLLLVRFFANKFYKQDALGLGDVKMVTVAGLGLGLPDVFLAIALGSCLGIIHGFFLSQKNKTSLSNTQVPAGAGLSIGIAVIFLLKAI